MPGGTDILKAVLSALFFLGCTLISGVPGQAVAQDAAGKIYVEHTGPRPSNAVITNKGWRCQDGFALAASGRCEAVKAPANAIVVGNSWRCMPGFAMKDTSCVQLTAPAYGQIQGDRIRCRAGFVLDDDGQCMAVAAPANGVVSGGS